ncbi:MAG: DUF3239 domain-containing protein [Planctomycetaceae bacterium]
MIELQCECGKRYRVPDELAGKRIRCKSCQAAVLVPDVQIIDVDPETITEVTESSSPVQPSGRGRSHRQESRPSRPTPKRRKPRDLSDVDPAMKRELDEMRRKSSSSASNPGLLRISYPRWVKAFPKWVFIWHGCCLACFAMVPLTWSAFIPACMMLAAVGLYWQKVKTHFIAGCVNPAMIFSLDPPLVAVTTDLTKGSGDYDVIRILPQPLAKMSTGLPEVGEQVATVSLYEDLEESQAHWSNFNPVVVDIVTTDNRHIDRILNSIEDEDWDLLETGLQQIGDWRDPGLYRIFAPDFQTEIEDEEEQFMIVQDELAGLEDYGVYTNVPQKIPSELRANAVKTYARGIDAREIMALAPSWSKSENGRVGLLISIQGLHYSYPECGAGAICWDDLQGVFVAEGIFELIAVDGHRVRIPGKHFRYKSAVKLESAINQILGH